MHDDRQLLEARLTRFVHDHLEQAVYRDSAPLSLTAWPLPGEPVPFVEAVRHTFRPIEIGTPWGRPWSTLWIHVIGSIPANWAAVDGTVPEMVVDLGFTAAAGFQAEGLAYRPDGTTIKAVSPFNNHVPVQAGEPIDIYLEAAANPDVATTGFHPTPNGDPATLAGTELYVIKKLALGLRDIAVWELRADIWTLAGLMNELPVSSSRRAEILVALQRAIDVADPDDVAGTAAAARAELAEALAQPASASAHRMVAVGHAHIDCAWLWPVRETIRKCARTFSNVVHLADADPTFVFACSSAQQLRLDQAVLSGAVRQDHREGPGRPVRPGRRNVGGVRHQHARRRGDGPPVRGRQELLPGELRRRDRGGLAARLLRLLRRTAPDRARRRARAGSSPRRSPGTRSTPCRTTPSGGRASTAAGCSPTSRLPTRTTRCSPAASWPRPSGSTRRRGEAPPRCCRSGTATAAAGRPAR